MLASIRFNKISVLGKVIMLTVLGKTDMLRRDYSIFKKLKTKGDTHSSVTTRPSVFVSGAREKLITT